MTSHPREVLAFAPIRRLYGHLGRPPILFLVVNPITEYGFFPIPVVFIEQLDA